MSVETDNVELSRDVDTLPSHSQVHRRKEDSLETLNKTLPCSEHIPNSARSSDLATFKTYSRKPQRSKLNFSYANTPPRQLPASKTLIPPQNTNTTPEKSENELQLHKFRHPTRLATTSPNKSKHKRTLYNPKNLKHPISSEFTFEETDYFSDNDNDKSEDFVPLSNKVKSGQRLISIQKRRLSSRKSSAPKRRKVKEEPEIICLSDSEDEAEEEAKYPLIDNEPTKSKSAYRQRFTITPKAFCARNSIFESNSQLQTVTFLASKFEYSISGTKESINYAGSHFLYGYNASRFALSVLVNDPTIVTLDQDAPTNRYFTMIFEHDVWKQLKDFSNIYPNIMMDNIGSVSVDHENSKSRDMAMILNFYQHTIDAKQQRIQTRSMAAGKKRQANTESKVILIWPPQQKDAVSLLESDLDLLEPEEFLNDNIIDFYIKYIRYRIFNGDYLEDFYFFNTFLYKMIKHRSNFDSSSILKWTGDVDIFQKSYIVIPINESVHWLLAIVCFAGEAVHEDKESLLRGEKPRCCILLFDSMSSISTSRTITKYIREYLTGLWKQLHPQDTAFRFNSGNLPVRKPQVPQQSNGSDCGVFLLHFLEKFVGNPQWDSTQFNKSWFVEEEIASKRRDILSIIYRLKEEAPNGPDANQNESVAEDNENPTLDTPKESMQTDEQEQKS